MGMQRWLKRLQDKAEKKIKDAENPKQLSREDARKTAERNLKAIKLAKKGLDSYNDAAKKVDDVTTDVAKKTLDVVEKAKPVAEKVDAVAETLLKKAGHIFNSAKSKATKKVKEFKEDQAKKPSTGSGVLDLLAPAVPETKVTRPKTDKKKAPKSPQP